MSSKSLRSEEADIFWRNLDHLSAEFRADVASRTAAEIIYDECVLTFLSAGRSIQFAVEHANVLHPAEALQFDTNIWPAAETYYRTLSRLKLVDGSLPTHWPHCTAGRAASGSLR